MPKGIPQNAKTPVCENPVLQTFQERLEDEIERSGVTQAEIAQAVGISPASISAYLCNKKEAGISQVKKIADYFGCTVDYLLGGSENRTLSNAEIGTETGLSDDAIETLKAMYSRYKKPERKNLSEWLAGDYYPHLFVNAILAAPCDESFFELFGKYSHEARWAAFLKQGNLDVDFSAEHDEISFPCTEGKGKFEWRKSEAARRDEIRKSYREANEKKEYALYQVEKRFREFMCMYEKRMGEGFSVDAYWVELERCEAGSEEQRRLLEEIFSKLRKQEDT